jgi:hypothetical protein
MNPRQARSLLSLYAVDVFLDTNAERLPRTCATGMRIKFKRALAELELHVQVQSGAPLTAMGLTRAKDAKREALLRDHIAPIVRVARLESASHPDLASLRMPRGEPGTQKLLALAAGMASIAADHRDVFVAAGLRPTFVEDFNAAIDDLLATLTARSERRGARSGATRGVDASLRVCTKYKAVLGAFIQTEARDDRPLLMNWRTVQRVGRSSRHQRKSTMLAAPSPTPALTAPPLPIRDAARLLAVRA